MNRWSARSHKEKRRGSSRPKAGVEASCLHTHQDGRIHCDSQGGLFPLGGKGVSVGVKVRNEFEAFA